MAEERPPSRLAFVDLARGLAVLLMLQTHAYDAWLRPELRETEFFRRSQLIGGLPAAFFLSLMGVSAAIGNSRSRDRGAVSKQLLTRGLKRGGLLLVAAFLFRVAMYLASDRPDVRSIFHVDVLNCLAVSLALLSLLELVDHRATRVFVAVSLASWFAMMTSFVWDGGLIDGLPERLAGYLTGRVPNTTFPIFPWAAFAFAGYAIGAFIASRRVTGLRRGLAWLTGLGIALIPLAQFFDSLETIGPRYDYWWTSPNFILYKTGVLLLLLMVAYGIAEGSRAMGGFAGRALEAMCAGLVQMGRTSLFIYCVHVDIVYGSRALPKLWRSCEINEASRNLALLAFAMLALSYVWVWMKAQVSVKLAARRG